ncbi:MAG: S46 family peptidase [Bacteroidales bacterium]|jgi:V8-like Glu-specific endopeptidase|nr:S46 family peptidase [Bacteroidales bacterium]
MKKLALLLCGIFMLNITLLHADEGMWLPIFLKYNEAEMQKMGFKLTAEDIYSINQNSMKDAIMLFGGGCTAELISADGLLVTNHHCGYSYVQGHSTLEHNYLQDGFWAKNHSEEIANSGLTVTFLVRMEDVTNQVLDGITDLTGIDEREVIIQKNMEKLKKEAIAGTHYTAVIKPFFYGNQYFMFINEIYKDIRLVGVPPESIGKFGGDTDNWVWPRHTGDFSLYRIYTAPNGSPAEYNEQNVPLKSKRFFPVSIKGVQENDFTLVFGYPGSTTQFLTSDGVDLIVNHRNPVAIDQRGARLNIMKKHMDQSPAIRLMYSAKANNISNGWKKWIGENKGIMECKVIARKKIEEVDFQQWANASQEHKSLYGNILPNLHNDYAEYRNLVKTCSYIGETFAATELLRFLYSNFWPVIKLAKDKTTTSAQLQSAKDNLIAKIGNFYATYYQPIDKEVFVKLMDYYFSTLDPALIPDDLKRCINLPENEWRRIATAIYDNSPFATAETFTEFVKNASAKQLVKMEKNEAMQLLMPAYTQYFEAVKRLTSVEQQLDNHYRIYVKALMEKNTQKVFYPDANLTLRVTYGKVQGFSPEDGKEYLYYTTIKGIMDKENQDIFDYKVDSKLKALYEANDFGRYANEKGELPVAFIASNHTTGGNSGSPVISAAGELIGINFDRVWEGTMSDVNYDVSRCRNISLDTRYMLFIIDKFANAQNIINELKIMP